KGGAKALDGPVGEVEVERGFTIVDGVMSQLHLALKLMGYHAAETGCRYSTGIAGASVWVGALNTQCGVNIKAVIEWDAITGVDAHTGGTTGVAAYIG